MQRQRVQNAIQRTCWAVCVCVLASCQASPVTPDIYARDTPAKIPGIMHAVQANQQEYVPELVAALDDDDPAVRLFAIEALAKMTDQHFGYVWYATRQKRQPALIRWRAFRDDLFGHFQTP